MTTFIGRLGRMMPTGCVAEESIEHEQRVVLGGGAGTLSPRRARVYGPGARSWQMTVANHTSSVNATLNSLARSQSLYGGSYRVIPCDALRSNIMTPRMSDELYDWTNLSVGPQSSFLGVYPDEEGIFPALMGRRSGGGNSISGHIPVPYPARMWAYIYASGVGELIVRRHSTAGSYNDEIRFAYDNPVNTPRRVGGTWLPYATTVSIQLIVNGVGETFVAWPSVAYQDHPYSIGKGCDSALVTMPSRNPLKTTAGIERSREVTTYEIIEVDE